MAKPKIKLITNDLALLGKLHRAANKAGWSEKMWRDFRELANDCDDEGFVKLILEYFEIE